MFGSAMGQLIYFDLYLILHIFQVIYFEVHFANTWDVIVIPVALIYISIFPDEFSWPMFPVILPLACILIAIGPRLCAIAMSLVIPPLALIEIPILPPEFPVSLSFIPDPLPDVFIAVTPLIGAYKKLRLHNIKYGIFIV